VPTKPGLPYLKVGIQFNATAALPLEEELPVFTGEEGPGPRGRKTCLVSAQKCNISFRYRQSNHDSSVAKPLP
jgi:hypothetical protein